MPRSSQLLCCAPVLALLVAYTMPPLRGHLYAVAPNPRRARGIVQVLADRNHQKALLFSALVLCYFAVIPLHHHLPCVAMWPGR